jgi:demethylmenaquinone methyltransferase / 2-methoxy-6-polyprenyl-1,4-benzoquinol methylase
MSQEPIEPPHPVLTGYYADASARRQKVDQMFNDSAEHYDWINSMMSFGSGEWYRQQALLRAGLKNGHELLDVGAGTGVIAAIAQGIVGEQGRVVALDPSPGMLAVAKSRGVKNTMVGLGEDLPFPDNSFDMVTMGYALRHVADLARLFAEYRRVLKPGGKVLILEITRPQSALARLLLKIYMKGIVPNVTRFMRGSKPAQELMRYYWDTIDQCVPPQKIVDLMSSVGLQKVNRHKVQAIFSEYTGVKE